MTGFRHTPLIQTMPHAPKSFVPLHNHTEYSLLDGASRIPAMVARAAELEMPALGLTDHGVMYGAIHFYKACRDAAIKPIVGCEVYVAPRSRLLREGRVDRDPSHLTLLAADHAGYLNLMRLCSIGQMEGMYYRPRIDKEVLAEHSKGLIALSGCLQGEAASRIVDGDVDGAREAVAAYRDIFGKDRFLLEVQRHGIDRQNEVNAVLARFSKELGLRLCATNDLHYVHRHDSEAHDVLLCLQTGARFNDPNRWRFSTQENYLKTPAEMLETFADLPEALASTLEVADQCDLKIDLGATLLPPFDVPDGLTPDGYLRRRPRARGAAARHRSPRQARARVAGPLEDARGHDQGGARVPRGLRVERGGEATRRRGQDARGRLTQREHPRRRRRHRAGAASALHAAAVRAGTRCGDHAVRHEGRRRHRPAEDRLPRPSEPRHHRHVPAPLAGDSRARDRHRQDPVR